LAEYSRRYTGQADLAEARKKNVEARTATEGVRPALMQANINQAIARIPLIGAHTEAAKATVATNRARVGQIEADIADTSTRTGQAATRIAQTEQTKKSRELTAIEQEEQGKFVGGKRVPGLYEELQALGRHVSTGRFTNEQGKEVKLSESEIEAKKDRAKALLDRATVILRRKVDLGVIDEAQYQKAVADIKKGVDAIRRPKVGTVVTLKDGTRRKVTGYNPDGSIQGEIVP
jgi:hypothetical protein